MSDSNARLNDILRQRKEARKALDEFLVNLAKDYVTGALPLTIPENNSVQTLHDKFIERKTQVIKNLNRRCLACWFQECRCSKGLRNK